jgi:hypothetical protein
LQPDLEQAFHTHSPDLAESRRQHFVAAVCKRPGANHFSFISIGRMHNNDIVIPASSVSKCHAVVQVVPPEGHRIRDAESTNGTLLNGRAVSSREFVSIAMGDQLQFSAGVSAEVISSSATWSWLRHRGVTSRSIVLLTSPGADEGS